MVSVSISPSTVGPLKLPEPCLASTPPLQVSITAVVTGDPGNLGVTFAVSQGAGSVQQTGPFSTLYYPPITPPGIVTGAKATVSATSVTDKAKSATVTVLY